MATNDRRERYEEGSRTIRKTSGKKKPARKTRDTSGDRVLIGNDPGPRTRKVFDYTLTEKQYQYYLRERERDPQAGLDFLTAVGKRDTTGELPEIKPAKPGAKSEVVDESSEVRKAKARGAVVGPKAKAEAEEKADVARRTAISEAQANREQNALKPRLASASVADERIGRPDIEKLEWYQRRYGPDFGRGNATPSQRRVGGALTEYFAKEGKTPLVYNERLVAAENEERLKNTRAAGLPASEAQLTAIAPVGKVVWIGDRGGIPAPARGHMNDPDAPRGRAGGPEIDTVWSLAKAYDDILDWTPQKVAAFQQSQGLNPTGLPTKATQDAWEGVVNLAARMYARGQKVSPFALASADMKGDMRAGGGVGAGRGVGEPKTTVAAVLTNRGAAKRLLNALFQDRLGRSVTENDVSKFQAMLNEAERKHPVTTASSGLVGDTTSSQTTGGIDVEQYGEDYLRAQMGGEVNARTVGVDYFEAALKAIGAAI